MKPSALHETAQHSAWHTMSTPYIAAIIITANNICSRENTKGQACGAKRENKTLWNVHQLLSEILSLLFLLPTSERARNSQKRKENDQQHRKLAHSTVGYSSLECLRAAWSLEPSPMYMSSISPNLSSKETMSVGISLEAVHFVSPHL